MSQEIVFSKKK